MDFSAVADYGWGLYVVLAILLVYFWWQVRGASFDALLKRAEREHHAVHKVLAKHPRGGAWGDYRRWRQAP